MTVWVYLPLILSLVVAAASRPLASRLSPQTATPALVLASGLSALATTWGLLLLAGTLLREAPPLAERAAGQGIVLAEPAPGKVAVAAAAVLAVGAYRLGVLIRSRRSVHQRLRLLCDSSAAEELVVVAASEPHAVAVPGRRGSAGRILVTSGMLAALSVDERAALLAHERAHLRGRHSWQQAAVDAAAALNPLLVPARDSVAFLLERAADEAAAVAVGSRSVVARSLARAALAGSSSSRPATLAFERLAVTSRVAALHAPPAPRRPLVVSAVISVGLATTLAAGNATASFFHFFERLPLGIG